MSISRRQTLALLGTAPFAAGVHAQSKFPDRPIKLIVPYPPGGQTDAVARLFAQKVEGVLGQPVVVDNRPGANSMIGSEAVARAPADGYTLLFNMTALVTNPLLLPQVNYDPFRDFAPVARCYEITGIWAVPPQGPRTLAEFMQRAREAPKPLSFGTAGHASTSHYFGEIISRAGGFSLNHVPYKGEAPILPDLMSGRLDAGVVSGYSAMQFAGDGRIRVLATTGAQRIPSLPQLPTFQELGIGGLTAESFAGVFAPAKTPPAVVDRLADAFTRAGALPDVRERIAAFGLQPPTPITPTQFAAVMRKAYDEWAAIKSTSAIQLQ
ncbi:Bug family tripartite tricarboxylate transporter substrate binding protein [Pseudacidovorax intermedius]|uniref:Tripartite-type tricarboxylate transporter receptor subunit TctC n=1 Tax=Pseudacidovorax intermedius TaxID=433924 RepID=A0A370F3V5_9BURK|nr:tripartite tricarboxylate transporter substrate binding protein [Pseudacidovorax intermedius]RDI17774.1 tripartite-type tricarboxylate transporter receptor subunit TctC [Pseudacidovorax intermedius]